MHANPFGAAVAAPARCDRTTADRPQHGRAPLGRAVVGEDVVDLVAAPARRLQAADVGPLAVAALDLLLGLAGVELLLLVVRVAVLGQAEVDEGAVPSVSKGHAR